MKYIYTVIHIPTGTYVLYESDKLLNLNHVLTKVLSSRECAKGCRELKLCAFLYLGY